ncbi:TonB-dependent receptor plug domain-containing protein [Marinobacteraceae bacterium S3BR75-40.1]
MSIKYTVLASVLISGTALQGYAQDFQDDASLETSPSMLELGPGASMPEVLSATRLRQPKSRVPGTVTILRGELLRELGVSRLWEAFLLVPGMTVGYVSSNVPIVSYHGTAANEQRRLQVLVDGRAVYKASLANVEWHNVPVPLEEIDRIEVIRGPDAAAYGVNSFLAVINIITKNPQDTHGVRGKVAMGNRGYENHYASVGDGNDLVDWRLSYSRSEGDGFDYRYYNTDDEALSQKKQTFDDSFGFNTVNFDSIWQLTDDDSLEVLAGAHNGYDQRDREEFAGDGLITDPKIQSHDWHGQIKWNHKVSEKFEFHLQYYQTQYDRNEPWVNAITNDLMLYLFGITEDYEEMNHYSHPADLCERAASDPSILPAQDPPVAFCTFTNQDIREERKDVELQGTYRYSPDLQLVAGTSYREDNSESDTYLNGTRSNYIGRVFGNLEYSPASWLTTNIGAMWEDDNDNGNFLSPRYAFNFHLTRSQTVRFVWSKSYRTPDDLEQSADWGYRLTGITVSPALSQETQETIAGLEGERLRLGPPAPGGLEAEQIISREVSYYGLFRLPVGSLSLEAKAFHDSMNNNISGILSASDTDNLENNMHHTQDGIELETMLELVDDTFRLTYAYLDPDSEYIGSDKRSQRFFRLETRMSAQHSGSASWIHQFPRQVSLAGTFYYAKQADYPEQHHSWRYQRLDLHAAKTFLFPRTYLELSATVQYYPLHDYITVVDNNFDNTPHFIVAADLRF